MKRGFVYTLEAVFAGMLIMTFLVFITGSLNPIVTDDSLSFEAADLLEDLDNQGLLRNYTAADDVVALNSAIRFFSANHSVQICDEGTCYGDIPAGDNVFSGTYIIAGNHTYDPHYVRLYLWR